ncbi:hypothetical protein [Deinococcus marmoris]|uniref:hypothetical protein n=1 Tax=Deinococcus marmoris TaxID=249408 RepID=UPI0004985129|nr:hypothetical protein [Deinococcus marmoris]
MTASDLSFSGPTSGGLPTRLLASGLLYGGLAALAAGTPGPLSSPALWVCGVLAALSAGHAAVTMSAPHIRPAPARFIPAQAQARSASTSAWTVPAGWQAGFSEGRPVLTRPDGRAFLVTDQAVASARGMTVLWWLPGSGAAPRWAEGVWQVGGGQADVLALAEAL